LAAAQSSKQLVLRRRRKEWERTNNRTSKQRKSCSLSLSLFLSLFSSFLPLAAISSVPSETLVLQMMYRPFLFLSLSLWRRRHQLNEWASAEMVVFFFSLSLSLSLPIQSMGWAGDRSLLGLMSCILESPKLPTPLLSLFSLFLSLSSLFLSFSLA
jgi:hypothetical protein